MKDPIKQLPRILKETKGKHLCIFLDFDGTISVIRKDPYKVGLSREMEDVIRKLAARKEISVAIVTGRKLDDIKRRVKIKSLIYVGNHGLEAEGPGIKYVAKEARKARAAIFAIYKILKKELAGMPAVIVEDKKLTLSVHYRRAPAAQAPKVESIVKRIIDRPVKRGEVAAFMGRKIWEVRPPEDLNKGTIVQYLLSTIRKAAGKSTVPVYIGDDITDEDAFRKIKKGYTVKVGLHGIKNTKAEYFLKNVSGVKKFLKTMYRGTESRKAGRA